MQIKFTTRRDANTFVQNAGITDWAWSGNASADGFADWIYRNRDAADTDNGSSPRTRGTGGRAESVFRHRRFIPAHAGNSV